jgi:oligosaccharide repeat unit polymerase
MVAPESQPARVEELLTNPSFAGRKRLLLPIAIWLVSVLVAAIASLLGGDSGGPLLAAAILTTLAVMAKLRFRDWLYPPVLQAGLWAFLSVWFWFARESFYRVEGRTWAVIVVGAASFFLGAWLATLRHSPLLKRNEILPDSLPYGIALPILFIVSIAVLPVFLTAASSVAPHGLSLFYIVDVRMSRTLHDPFGRLYIAFWWALTCLGVSLLNFLHRPKQARAKLVLVLAVALALVYAVAFGGRGAVLFVFLVLAGIPLILRRLPSVAVAVPFGLVTVGLFVSYAYLSGHMGLSIYSPAPDDFEIVHDLAAVYLLGPIANLGQSVPRVGGPFGIDTFRIIYLWLTYLGWNVEVKPMVLSFSPISPVWSTNIYTIYRSYYQDFGLAGVVIAQFAFGLWHGVLYRRATQQRPRAFWVMLYGVFLYPLFMQVAADQYMSCLSNWIHFFFIFTLFLVVVPALRRHQPGDVDTRASVGRPSRGRASVGRASEAAGIGRM